MTGRWKEKMEDMSGAVAPETGVTEDVETQVQSSPEASPTSPQQQAQGEKPTQEQVEEMISRREYNKAQERLRKAEKQLQELGGAASLHHWLRSENPEGLRTLFDIMAGRQPQLSQQQPQQPDPYAEYDPFVAERLRKLDAMEQKLTGWEQQQQEYFQQQQVAFAQSQADQFHNQLLAQDKFLDEKGNPTNPELVQGLEMLTRSFLAEVSKNPIAPTNEEVQEAYELAKPIIKAAQRSALKQTIAPSVPATGSRRGVAPRINPEQPKTDSRADRVQNLLAGMG
jgi:hypothetical protein